jgi:hypothetical protein
LPSSMVGESAGINIGMGMGPPLLFKIPGCLTRSHFA